MVLKAGICRLCLTTPEEESSSISLFEESIDNDQHLSNTGHVLKKHFWFDFGDNEYDLLSKFICTKCWTYIEQFDDFYNLIKTKHEEHYGDRFHVSIENGIYQISYDVKRRNDGHHLASSVTAIKQEPTDIVFSSVIHCSPLDVIEADYLKDQKQTDDDYRDYDCKDNDSDTSSSESEEEYKPPKKLKSPRKSAKKSPVKKIKSEKPDEDRAPLNDAKILKYFKMECTICESKEKFESYADATNHYKNVHILDRFEMNCICCEKKFTKLNLMRQHCEWHDDPDAYKCSTCEKPFNSKLNLKKHLQIHEENLPEPLKCKNCGKEFYKKYLLVKHTSRCYAKVKKEKTINDVGGVPKPRKMNARRQEQLEMLRKQFRMQCDLCATPFDTFNDAMAHYKSVHDQNGYLICCDKKIFRLSRAIQHCLWHINPELFKCEICNKTFLEKGRLISHVTNIHTPEDQRTFKCDLCPKSYAKEHMLTAHKRINHIKNEDKTFECDVCAKRFGLMRSLRVHIENVHENKYSHMCDICAKSFKSAKCYEMHYLSEHTDIDQKVQCELCGKWLKHKEGLKTHMRFHAATTEQCPICGRISTNKKALRAHIKIAHTPATLQCSICFKMFKKHHALREHVAVHTGVKDLYKCSFCPKTFRSNSNMYKHRKQMHPQEYAENKANGGIW